MKLNHIRALGIEAPKKENEQEEQHFLSSYLSGKGESVLSTTDLPPRGRAAWQCWLGAATAGKLRSSASQTAEIASLPSSGCADKSAAVWRTLCRMGLG